MRNNQVLLLAALAVVLLACAFTPAESIRQYNRLPRAAIDGDFERYAVRVSRAAESAWDGASRRARTARGRVMQATPPSSGTCAAGETTCGSTCVNTTSSPENCGECFNVCGATETCCGGVCVDTDSDEFNCGECGKECSTTCRLGVCGY